MRNKKLLISFFWQHLWLLFSLFVMTLGVAALVRSNLGSSVISVLPYAFQSAGAGGCGVPSFTIGQYTYLMNVLLVVGQIAVLRRQFEMVQFFQLLIGFVFGMLLDLNMLLTEGLVLTELWQQVCTLVAGCIILGVGISLEVHCGSVTMPGEGFPAAVSKVTGFSFPKVKIALDIVMVLLGILACFLFFGAWQSHIVGVGTLVSMVAVGLVVRFVNQRLGWFDKVLTYQPGFRRYIYGLARYKKKKN
ncbi:MAG: hypothetical protein II623_11130 [Paludibacteraceae bacterium]|nr:hypothetical protein [Paludibacteraceae bacterium]MBR6043602.1 hypothetical protein [Paludibacteraceae bacterium]